MRDYQPINNFTTLSIPEKLARYSSSRICFIKKSAKLQNILQEELLN